mmetsp:Transcript_28653/g.66992  ORF Transcript_28653/g.66992 Transcript_28653/m.66992 type:complete len:433 (+) Transcript_28653:107-1405(+)|eukprot:CAMPEP_0114135670 /NCGR_PEP_ID=MMETSP0043_2-20121206/14813_1 /TAXON_ID=464988 /ORGANISM="Hemiselmis andersenii, Strain CCMP644" /LENGTH=432 /DNA_ID=CAMNT_0001229389 /DNA_START=81 /DNA_END=1379 /DNA_ORIENTATION=+
MAGTYKVTQLDDGSITIDCPADKFPDTGYFTMFDNSAASKGMKSYSFHKYAEKSPYTKEHFKLKAEDERPGWTVLSSVTDKDGNIAAGRDYVPASTGFSTLGKKGADAELIGNLTVDIGLTIPPVSEGNEPNLRSRMYRNKYPDVEDIVFVLVKRIDVMGVYVSLLEYDETEGMILLSELSRRRIRSVKKLINVGRQEVALVLRVDKDKGYIDLSKRRVSPEDVEQLEEKFNKSKAVHSIMRNLATTERRHVEDLYESFGWELADEHGHLLDSFKRLLTEPTILDKYQIPADIKTALLKNIEMRLTPQPVKVRSDFEVTCFAYEGIDAIKAALTAGMECGTELNPITCRLIAPPLYVMTCNTLDQDFGIKLLEGALDKVKEEIAARKGEIVIKMAPTAVGAEEEEALKKALEEAQRLNQEIEGDDDDDEDDD